MTNQIALTTRTGLTDVLSIIAMSALAESTKTKYTRAIERYFQETGSDLTDVEALVRHAQTLPKSGKAFLKAALKLWTARMAVHLQGLSDPTADLSEVFELNQRIQAALYKFNAMNEAIQIKQTTGTKTHIWLSQVEADKLRKSCSGEDDRGVRDRAVLGLMTGAGLRCAEASQARFDDLVMVPIDGEIRTAINVTGKGAKDRTIPLSGELAAIIERWGARIGAKRGRIARAIAPDGRIRKSMSTVAIFDMVRKHGEVIGRPELAPHDLRRTFAQLAYEAGIPVTQISVLLGHASVATTQRYLNLSIDYKRTASDFIPV